MTDPEEVLEPVVLVTVFGPFPGQPVNPTELIADALAGEDHVVSHVLDVSFERSVARIDELVAMVDPAAVVAFGVVAGATGIRLEEVARNASGSPALDVDGEVGAPGPIDAGPDAVRSRLPLAAIADALAAAGIAVEPSEDAGGYVCNRVFRHIVTHPALEGRPVGFIHVPAPGPGTTFDPDMIAVAGRIVVDTVAAHTRGEL